MNTLIEWITCHADYAHWYIFAAIILAGFNFPLCIDLLVLVSAFIAASILPEHTLHLFFSVLLGCFFSAWCAYWLGRLLGGKLQQMRLFSKLLQPKRMKKMRAFYEKHGLWTLIVGRFIPFGVRNCLFMTTGASKVNFLRFVLMDALACLIWCTTCFCAFYALGQNYRQVWKFIKTFNMLIFIAFSVTLITFIWYKNRRKSQKSNVKSI